MHFVFCGSLELELKSREDAVDLKLGRRKWVLPVVRRKIQPVYSMKDVVVMLLDDEKLEGERERRRWFMLPFVCCRPISQCSELVVR